MTGEQLNRKYHELCGWKYREGPHPYLHVIDGPYWEAPGDKPDGDRAGTTELPPLHLDANLAIAEIEKLGGHLSLSTVEGDADCPVQGRHWNVFVETNADFKEWPEACAKTLNEAILKALIAAKERK